MLTIAVEVNRKALPRYSNRNLALSSAPSFAQSPTSNLQLPTYNHPTTNTTNTMTATNQPHPLDRDYDDDDSIPDWEPNLSYTNSASDPDPQPHCVFFSRGVPCKRGAEGRCRFVHDEGVRGEEEGNIQLEFGK